MVNRDRMVQEFMELVRIDSLSKDERRMADTLKGKLEALGYEVLEDDAGARIGGNSGNLICTVKGGKAVPTLLLMAHMDTVVPGIGKKPILEDGIIKTDGTTILGGDDAAGIECILEALRVIRERGIPHGDLQIVFSVAEEGGLLGSKHLDYSRINSKYAVVLDGGGPIGSAAVKAPSQNKIDVTVRGKAAHAGMEPEKGVSAIKIAAAAIAEMKLGRIDFETTSNIGIIHGGQAVNIVCDQVQINAEARSRDMGKLQVQTDHMRECFEKAAQAFGGSVEFKAVPEYPSYNIPGDAEILNILDRAASAAGIKLIAEETGGGSDTNILNGKGIQAVDISIGMDKVHSVEEQIKVDDMVKAAEYVVRIIENME